MATVRPRLRLAVLCASIKPDADGLPFALNYPTHTIRLPAGADRPRSFSLYAQIQGAWKTTCVFRIQVRDEQGDVIFTSPEQAVPFPDFEYRVMPREHDFRFEFAFPAPGVYFVHLLCEGRSLHEGETSDDRPFPPAQLNVIA